MKMKTIKSDRHFFAIYAMVAVISLLVFEYVFWSNGFRYLEEETKEDSIEKAELLRDLLISREIIYDGHFERFADEYAQKYGVRITIIDEVGKVLGESEMATELLTNHLDREEVQQALNGESYSSIRKSDTFGIEYCYCAVPIQIDDFRGVMRVAVSMKNLRDMNGDFLRSTIMAMLVLVLVIFALIMSARQYLSAMRKVANMRKEFVSNVTHELKTPLTSIRGFVETLKAGAIEDPKIAMKFLDIIELESQRLTNLINDTLSLSEIENKREIEKIPSNMNEVIQEVIELLQPKVKDHVRLIFKPNEDIKDYPCHRDHMKQLMINLIDNGLKATEFGAITINCRMIGTSLLIEVADTGIGMEEEQLERIFERFYRVDKGRSKAQGGTGLGLSIVKHIVNTYKGTIEVESEVGIGTIFKVKLPY